MSARGEFDDLLAKFLIPEFCSDPNRRMDTLGFAVGSNRVSEADAADFLRAWKAGLASHQGRGQYFVGSGGGRVREQFFWSGSKVAEPRTFTLWMEPVITVGAIGRLHLDHGWPVSRLAAQSADWAYDIVATAPDGMSTAIAGEVKKTCAEADDLIKFMVQFGSHPDAPQPAGGKQRNAFKKVASLRTFHAPLIWIIGPERYEQVMRVDYRADGVLNFKPTSAEDLVFLG